MKIFDIFVRCYGPLDDTKGVEVQVGRLKYQLPNLLAAVNLAFKTYKVFQKPFALSTVPCWKFLEEHVFKFEVKDILACTVSLNEKLARFTEQLKRKLDDRGNKKKQKRPRKDAPAPQN